MGSGSDGEEEYAMDRRGSLGRWDPVQRRMEGDGAAFVDPRLVEPFGEAAGALAPFLEDRMLCYYRRTPSYSTPSPCTFRGPPHCVLAADPPSPAFPASESPIPWCSASTGSLRGRVAARAARTSRGRLGSKERRTVAVVGYRGKGGRPAGAKRFRSSKGLESVRVLARRGAR